MNGLVVHTMGFTGYARLNSNKDANNRSRSCGQGCESWPFTGEGMQVQVHEQKQMAFQVASLPDSSDDPVLTARVPYKVTVQWQTNQNKRKMSELSSSLHTTPQSCPLTPPPPNISKEKWVQRRIQPAPACNLTLDWKSTSACFQAIDRASHRAQFQ